MNHAVRKPVTNVQTKRRRRRSISVNGFVPPTPADAAAFEVPTAGVPTYFVASTAALAAGFAASGFGSTLPVSGSAMSLLLCCDYFCPNLNRRPPNALGPPPLSTILHRAPEYIDALFCLWPAIRSGRARI